MGYPSNIIHRASQVLEEQRANRESAFAARQLEIYQKLPRTAAIDRELKSTMAAVVATAFQRGTDPAAALASLRDQNLALQKEREELLTANGYPADALSDAPACPLCGDSGWRGAKMCQCLQELCAKEQINQLSSMLNLQGQSFEAFRLDVYPDTPDPNRGGLSPRQSMEMVRSLCQGYANEFPNYFFQNLYLSGNPGLGKTFLSACIARVVAARGYSVVYDAAGNVFAQFEARKFNRGSEQEALENTQRYLQCDLLILDDLGSEMTTAFTQSALYDVINTRLVKGKGTVISSNLGLDLVRERYSPQIYSRIAGAYRSIPFFGEDIRQLNKNQV